LCLIVSFHIRKTNGKGESRVDLQVPWKLLSSTTLALHGLYIKVRTERWGLSHRLPFGGLNNLLQTARQPWLAHWAQLRSRHNRPALLPQTEVYWRGMWVFTEGLRARPGSCWTPLLTSLKTGIPQIFPQIKRTNKMYYKNKQNLFFF
jgi:hypothetical protein